jgi:hypothetical protein
MAETTISILGMCQNECTWMEGTTANNGEAVGVIQCPDGRVCVSLGAQAARYDAAELEKLGEGHLGRGVIAVVREVAANPDSFQYQQPRPLNELI